MALPNVILILNHVRLAYKPLNYTSILVFSRCRISTLPLSLLERVWFLWSWCFPNCLSSTVMCVFFTRLLSWYDTLDFVDLCLGDILDLLTSYFSQVTNYLKNWKEWYLFLLVFVISLSSLCMYYVESCFQNYLCCILWVLFLLKNAFLIQVKLLKLFVLQLTRPVQKIKTVSTF